MKLLIAAAILLSLFILPLTAQAASQISIRDGLWLSMPPDSVKCVVVKLPRDSGLPFTGNYVFTVTCEPGPLRTWSDLSEQIVREITANNTFEIPVCFDTAGVNKPVGNCSEPWTITVFEENTGTSKSWTGGTCVSRYADVDQVGPGNQPSSGDDIRDILNDNTDLFAVWLEEETIYAESGQDAVFNLSVQANADLELVVLTQSDLSVSPGSARLYTTPASPQSYSAFTVQAPFQDSESPVVFRVSPHDCNGKSYCTKYVYGNLVVGGSPPVTDFIVTLTPGNLDIKEPEDVIMTMRIKNNFDTARSFTTSIFFEPDDVASGFSGETIEVPAHETKTRIFVIRPGTSSKLYEITARVKTGDQEDVQTSFITIDEMLTDALRQAEGLDADNEVDAWSESHQDSDHGSDLQEYESLREALARAEKEDPEPEDPEPGNGEDPEPEADFPWLILVAAIAGVGFVIGIVMMLTKKKDKKGQEYY